MRKINWLFEIVIIALVLAYAFFIVFQYDHEHVQLKILDDGNYEPVTMIKVMTYNIAHARGHLSMYEKTPFGRNFNIKSEEEVVARLDKIAELVKNENVDILVLQEVDFDATWSYNVNQAEYLAEKIGFSNVAGGLKWSVDLPFMKIRAGNAILTKFPILEARVRKFESEGYWRRFVGGHSYIDAIYLINDQPVRVLSAHFDSDSGFAREKSAEEFVKFVEEINLPTIIAGDFNTVTSETKKVNEKMRKKYSDNTIETFIESGFFDLSNLNSNDESMFTYSAENPHRLIDYIFTTNEMEVTEYYVERINLSDHFPLIARIKI